MATMIPATISYDAPSSEKRIFEMLRDDPATSGWTVLWSYRPRLFDLESGRRREVDFLILIPSAGILCLEVKGGHFDIRGGQWYPASQDESVEPPDRQSEQAMFSLRRELTQQFPGDDRILSTPLDFALAFTDWEWPGNLPQPTPLTYDSLIVDTQGLFTLKLANDVRVHSMGVPVRGNRRDRSQRTRQLNDDTIQRLVNYLAAESRTAIGPQLDHIDRQIVRLTEEQNSVLDMAAGNDRCLIRGAAGTGKTMLALEYARRAAQSDQRVGLVCFNVLLGNHLREQSIDYASIPPATPRSSSGITAGAFWPHIVRPLVLASPHADHFRDEESAAASEDVLYSEIYPRYARLALTDSGPQFDVLAVDETPDMCHPLYLELLDMVLTGGLGGGRWAMFGDFGNQAIFPSGELAPEEALQQYCPNPPRFNLVVNCRNTAPIALHTARVSGSEIPQTRPIEGGNPEYRYWEDADELSGLLDDEVYRLLDQGVDIGEIVVLSERRLENSGLDTTRAYGGSRLVTYRRGQRVDVEGNEIGEVGDAAPRLTFHSIPAFKGMEAEVVILILDRLDQNSSTELERPIDAGNASAYAYIGMSRARCSLVILAKSELREELETRLNLGNRGIE